MTRDRATCLASRIGGPLLIALVYAAAILWWFIR
jgi:hypothetical protein